MPWKEISERLGKEQALKLEKAAQIAEKSAKRESIESAVQELAELKADFETMACAILLLPLKKKAVKPEEIGKEFGKETRELAEKALKIQAIPEKASEEQKTEAFRKILLAMSKDLRVIMACFAAQIIMLKEQPSEATAKESEEIFAPLAHKLGMNRIKNMLQENAFETLHPEDFKKISKSIAGTSEERERQVSQVIETLTQKIREAGISAEIRGRAKQLSSVWRKMNEKSKTVDEIYDLMAIRIVTGSIKECYQVLGIVHELWQPISSEFKDYIAKPKPNLYQSLHTVIVGPNKKPIEIQIRTKEMHYIAETGIAAHWKYKGEESAGKLEKKITWLKEAIDWLQDSEKAKEFMDSLKLDFFENEIFVFTPKGQVIELPEGATPIDFAFAVHTDLGLKCNRAKVNGKAVPLNHELENGDSVEIGTSESQLPKRQWLNFVKSSKANTKIRQALQIQQGEKKHEKIRQVAIKSVSIQSSEDKAIKLAKCCKPVPGDEIKAFLTTKRKISVHRQDCRNAIAEKGQRIIDVSWDVKGKGKFTVSISIVAVEKPGLLSEILGTLAKAGARVISANAKTMQNNVAECSFEIETKSLKELEQIMQKMGSIKGVQKVERK